MNDDLIEQLATPHRSAPDRDRRARLIMSGVTLAALVTGGVSLTTGAIFTDTQRSDATFTTGTVALATNPATTVVDVPNMAPGDTSVTPITVSNTGSLEYRYALSDVATDADAKALSTQLVLSAYSVPVAADCTKAYTDTLTALGAKTGISTTGEHLFGDPAQGFQPGDRVLASAASEVLCIRVDEPLATANTYQGAATKVTFTFDAEQTANNP